MSRKFVDKLGRLNPFGSRCKELPKALPVHSSQRLVRVFVEGYEDVAFWRGVFDRFTNPYLRFEISVPSREDLPKGKKVLLGMIPQASDELLLCVDSDFDYLFHNSTEQSRELLSCDRMFHTYAYATENYLCYAPSLHNVCVRATKNDTRIFDFERFMADYSRIIYPLFLSPTRRSRSRNTSSRWPISVRRCGSTSSKSNTTGCGRWRGCAATSHAEIRRCANAMPR